MNLDLQLEFDLAGLTFFAYSILMGFAALAILLAGIIAGLIIKKKTGLNIRKQKTRLFIKGGLLLLILAVIGTAGILIIDVAFDYRENSRALRKFLDDIALYYVIAAVIASLVFALLSKKK